MQERKSWQRDKQWGLDLNRPLELLISITRAFHVLFLTGEIKAVHEFVKILQKCLTSSDGVELMSIRIKGRNLSGLESFVSKKNLGIMEYFRVHLGYLLSDCVSTVRCGFLLSYTVFPELLHSLWPAITCISMLFLWFASPTSVWPALHSIHFSLNRCPQARKHLCGYNVDLRSFHNHTWLHLPEECYMKRK